MEKLQITRAVADDAAIVHEIMRSAFAEYARVLQPPTGALSESVADVRTVLDKGGAILAWLGGIAVGCARFEVRGDHICVGRVAVLSAYRCRGVGSAMMRFIEEEARGHDAAAVRVGVRMSLPSNVALYRRLGYDLVDVSPHLRGPDMVGTLIKRLR